MKAGVSLVIDAGVVLAGSRLPADYDKGEKVVAQSIKKDVVVAR
jgi:hypothetical protein